MMKKMERFGSKDVTSFVIPIGYSFNLDGSALYQSIAALFVAQMYDIHLSLTEQLVLMATLMIASKVWLGCQRIYCSFINNINFYEHNSTRSCFNYWY